MQVRNQNRINLSETSLGSGHLTSKWAHAVPQQGIGQNPHAIHLNEHRGVPHVGQLGNVFHWTFAISLLTLAFLRARVTRQPVRPKADSDLLSRGAAPQNRCHMRRRSCRR